MISLNLLTNPFSPKSPTISSFPQQYGFKSYKACLKSHPRTQCTIQTSQVPSFESLKHRLIRFSETAHLAKAFRILNFMDQQGISPDLVTYCVLLKSCIRLRDFEKGKLVHAHLLQSGLEFDTVLLNSLISLYSKCGDWETSAKIFENMKTKDLVSWSALISGFAHNDQDTKAISTFNQMLQSGLNPNQFCFSSVIRACSCLENIGIGMGVFGFAIKTGFQRDICVGSAVIDMFAKTHDLDSARQVFDEMPERNVVVWTLMITRYTQGGFFREAIYLFLDLELGGFEPDRFSLSSTISACAGFDSFNLGQQLHSLAIRFDLCSDLCVGSSLVDMYAKCARDGSMEDSRKVFDRMPEHNVMSWTAIITGYVQNGGLDQEAINLFCEMMRHGTVEPNHFTFSSIFKACANLSNASIGEQIYVQAVKSGLALVNCVGNSFVTMYARSGRVDEAQKAFDVLFERNLVSNNAMVDGYAKNLSLDNAFKLFYQIENSEVEGNCFTFASLLSAAASIGVMGKGQQIHSRLLKAGFEFDMCISNALISMYSRCGSIEDAWQVFNNMPYRNVISWTSMVTGFAKHGYARKALYLFNEMVDGGMQPNEVTYVAVLSACSHVGLVEEGWKHFYTMHTDHGILPRMEHYACMVDLLGRYGFLEEGYKFINSMPFQADALVWRTLLGSCRVHRNMEIGELAARHILEIEPRDPAAYVLLSNLYAETGLWESAVEVRKSMKERKLAKEAGCSWIEVGNIVHKFFVADTSHPQTQEIFAKLHQLAYEIKRKGYVPDTKLVLHDVSEEQKEQYLLQHSEKIAIAFGIISTPSSRPMRIFKNLRVCGDCHNAIKFISIATDREIIVRDPNRFHHIKDGVCSCGEYW